MTDTFRIATTGQTGPRRWWIVRIHQNVAALRRAATAYHPGVDFTDCLGCCHTAGWYDTDGTIRGGRGGYAGIIRLAHGHLTPAIITHELVHAAVATYRLTVNPDVRLGRGVGAREEHLADLFGELFADFETHFQR